MTETSSFYLEDRHYLYQDVSCCLIDTRMARGGRPASADWGSRFSCSLKSDLGTWFVVSPCARTVTIQIARIFENLGVPGFNFMRNYVLAIPNWPNVPRCSQSFAFSLGALWFSWYYIIYMKMVILKPGAPGTLRISYYINLYNASGTAPDHPSYFGSIQYMYFEYFHG